MILVDTSIWIDHLSREHPVLYDLLERGSVLSHPFVAGEVTMGSLRRRDLVMRMFSWLPQGAVGRHDEVLRFVEQNHLYGLGIGYIDAHLLVSARLTPDAKFWTRDKRLAKVAKDLGLAFQP
jgi:predicted nucleic acid-binding protein